MRDRTPLSDESFADQIDLPSDNRGLIIAVRRAFARCCRVPPEAIYPDDSVYDLADILFPFVGWDELEFIFALELETSFKVRRGSINFPTSRARRTGWLAPRRIESGIPIREWITIVVPQLREVMRSQTS